MRICLASSVSASVCYLAFPFICLAVTSRVIYDKRGENKLRCDVRQQPSRELRSNQCCRTSCAGLWAVCAPRGTPGTRSHLSSQTRTGWMYKTAWACRLDIQNSLGMCKLRVCAWDLRNTNQKFRLVLMSWQLFICSPVVCSVTITNANFKRQPNVDALICREALTHQNLQW